MCLQCLFQCDGEREPAGGQWGKPVVQICSRLPEIRREEEGDSWGMAVLGYSSVEQWHCWTTDLEGKDPPWRINCGHWETKKHERDPHLHGGLKRDREREGHETLIKSEGSAEGEGEMVERTGGGPWAWPSHGDLQTGNAGTTNRPKGAGNFLDSAQACHPGKSRIQAWDPFTIQ